MRLLSSGMAAHVAGESLTLCTCVVLTRQDGTVLGFTSHDADVTIGGVTCQALTSVNATNVQQKTGTAVDNLEVVGLLNSGAITDTDILAGKYDGAKIAVSLVNWADTSMGQIVLLRGVIGTVTMVDGQYTAEVRSLTQRLAQYVLDVTSPTCRVRSFGNAQCSPPGTITAYQNTGAVVAALGVGAAGVAASTPYQINAGGGAVSPFAADAHYTGGATLSSTHAIDTSAASVPAPAAVYQTYRYKVFSYALGGLTPGASYQVRLHFAETFFNAANKRLFDVYSNGVRVLQSYDVFRKSGGQYVAVTELVTTSADSSGTITLQFKAVLDNPLCCGIEVITPAAAAIVAGAATLSFSGDTKPAGYYNYGQATFTSGALSGLTLDIKEHLVSGGNAVVLLAETPIVLPAIGDTATLTAGCDRRSATCSGKFANIVHFRGEPQVPGTSVLLQRGGYGS